MQKNPFAKIDFQKLSFTRGIFLDGKHLVVTVSNIGDIDSPKLKVEILNEKLSPKSLKELKELIIYMFDTDNDITSFYKKSKDYGLSSLTKKLHGLRFVKDSSVFESVIKSIAGQQVSIKVAGQLVKKIYETFGEKAVYEGEIYNFTPSPKLISQLHEQDLRDLGFPLSRTRALIEYAKLDVSGKFNINHLNSLSIEEIEKKLCSLKGVGPWTAQMIMLFGLDKVNIVPWADIGLHRAVELYYGLDKGTVNTSNIQSYFQEIKEYRSYITYYLWENMMNYQATESRLI